LNILDIKLHITAMLKSQRKEEFLCKKKKDEASRKNRKELFKK